jgi:hypothetical protein
MIYSLSIAPDVLGVIHVGTEKKTIKQLAIKLGKNDVGDLHLSEVPFKAPKDTSFDLSKINQLLKK